MCNGSQYPFRYDHAFESTAQQESVYAEVSPFVQSALDGYNVALFCYGQTGAGKTHTMFGQDGDGGAHRGIIPRAVKQILETIASGEREREWKYQLKASFLEIYQENIRDLLCDDDERQGKKYTIVQGQHGRHDVTDLLEWPVCSEDDVEDVIAAAQHNKTMAKTDMNDRSSRSHTVFTLRITATRARACDVTQVMHGTLHLVDLAGSERLSKSNATGTQLKETQAINKSLSSLSDVFVALGSNKSHVPFRNSKLTFLLQPSLSGQGKALLIANVSPSPSSAPESLCTLRFASMVNSCELGKAVKHCATEKGSVGAEMSVASEVSQDSVAAYGGTTPQKAGTPQRGRVRPATASSSSSRGAPPVKATGVPVGRAATPSRIGRPPTPSRPATAK